MMIRPEISRPLRRWSEILVGMGIALFGLWALQAQGLFFQALAGLVVLTGLAVAWNGWRRLRFERAEADPGIVQIVEGQISYFGPFSGGFMAVQDIAEIHLIEHGQTWRLVPAPQIAQAEALDIPVAAQGAAGLFDLFSALPGLKIETLIEALDAADPAPTRVLWRHPTLASSLRALH